jgi:hypothetical protein
VNNSKYYVDCPIELGHWHLWIDALGYCIDIPLESLEGCKSYKGVEILWRSVGKFIRPVIYITKFD